jgi:hypothetical protein
MHYPTYEEWFAGLDEAKQQQALALVAKLKAHGAKDAEQWARSEVEEDFAQLATYLIIHRIWLCEIERWSEDPEQWMNEFASYQSRHPLPVFADAAEAVKRLREAGVSAKDLGAVARLVAFSAAFGVVNLIDEGGIRDAGEDLPGWQLSETDADGNLTGRGINGIHESLLSIHEDSLKQE